MCMSVIIGDILEPGGVWFSRGSWLKVARDSAVWADAGRLFHAHQVVTGNAQLPMDG